MDSTGLYQDAIGWARGQQVVLPVEYYGFLQGRARAAAFSISGISVLDQIDEVKRSLEQALESGESFRKWKARAESGEIPLGLPAHRVETIFRTNIQGWYAAGRCRSHAENTDTMPYLMYSAVNDSRTRPAHAAMHGHIARVDDPIWKVWMPPAGFNCRCTTIQLTAEEAERRGGVTPFPGVSPDPGWDYSVCDDGPEEGVQRAISSRSGRCGNRMSAQNDNAPTDQVAVQLATREPWWCRHPSLIEAVAGYQLALESWGDRERLTRAAMGDRLFDRHANAVEGAAMSSGLQLEQGVVLRAYTDREHIVTAGALDMPLFAAMNQLAREMVHIDRPLSFADDDLYRIGLMILMMDEAIEALPARPAAYWRGVDVASMPEHLRQQWKDAHRKGRVVQYNGYTSAAVGEGLQYGGDWQILMHLESAREITPFSVKGEMEVVLPRGVQLEYRGIKDGYRTMYEQKEIRQVKKNRNFSGDDEEITALVRGGYTRERAIEILNEMTETRERWKRERSKPRTEKQIAAMKDLQERMQVEATAGITE